MTCSVVLYCMAMIIFMYVMPSQGQMGKECSGGRSCMPDQTCFHGYCKCNHGFVKNIHHCFPVRSYGQMCFVDGQCVDHRMVCGKRSETDIVMRCICDKYHVWDDSSAECAQSMNTTAMLESLQEKYDNIGRIEQEAKMVFVGVLVAGLFVVTVGIIFVIGCLIYGCCAWRRKKITYRPQAAERFGTIDPEKQAEKPKLENKGPENTGGNVVK